MFLRRFKSTYARNLFETLKAEETIFDKQIKFFDFCKQMSKLEKLYEEDKRSQYLIVEKLKRVALSAKDPIKDTVQFYCDTRQDFSSQLLVDTLEYLGKIMMTKEYLPYSDFSYLELLDS